MSSNAEVEAAQSITAQRVSSTLEHNARGLVEVHHLVDNWLEKVLVTWERAKDGHLAPQGDGETGNKRKKGVQRAWSPGTRGRSYQKPKYTLLDVAPGMGQPKGATIGSELLGGV